MKKTDILKLYGISKHLFHTLLGLFQLQTPHYNEKLDLTSHAVLPYDGPQPAL